MNFGMDHAPGAGSFGRPVELQPIARPLYYDCLLLNIFFRDLILEHTCSGIGKSVENLQKDGCMIWDWGGGGL